MGGRTIFVERDGGIMVKRREGDREQRQEISRALKQIDDDEKVTMIDFPQMVSVSHRNAQMYFDRDVECILKFFSKRFHLSLEDDKAGCDDLGSDAEDGRPSFLSINRTAGFLDKELAASGFTRKNQDEIEKIDSSSINGVTDTLDDPAAMSQPRTINDCGATLEKEIQGSDDGSDGGDVVLNDRLNKHRREVMRSARRTRRAISSRNSYKDKGGSSSHNSKVQIKTCNW